MIRYFAHCTDQGELSELGYAYADALIGSGMVVRIIAVELADLWDATPEKKDKRTGQVTRAGRPAARWTKHRALFGTPITSPYINIVCATPGHWQRLYTVGVRNVLITQEQPTKAGTLYQQVIVPTEEIASPWRVQMAPEHVTVVPVDLGAKIAQLTWAVLGPPDP